MPGTRSRPCSTHPTSGHPPALVEEPTDPDPDRGKDGLLLVAHPTPPVFDGPEDRNGRRNFDEIPLLGDYVTGRSGYIYDDDGGRGGPKPASSS